MQEALLERAGGNPLYAEQFARLFLERGSVDDLPLPENVQGIIAARLDALPTEEKRLLQDAAVLGKVFWSGGVSSLSGSRRRASQRSFMAWSAKGSSGASGARQSPARPSTPSVTSSSAKSHTAKCRVPHAPASMSPLHGGSRRSDVPRTMPSCSRTTT